MDFRQRSREERQKTTHCQSVSGSCRSLKSRHIGAVDALNWRVLGFTSERARKSTPGVAVNVVAQQDYAQQQAYPQAGYPQQAYPQSGPTPLSPADERTWAIAAHLSPFLASFVGLPFLGPLVIYLVFRDRGPFVRHHAAQALNFQIIVMIALVVFGLLSLALIGIPFLIATGVAAIVFQIIAAVEANNGKWYRYPLTPDWVK